MTEYPEMDLVCFASSFAYASAPNITHLTLNGTHTACGRTGWYTSEGRHPNGPDCLKCRSTWNRLPESVRNYSKYGGDS